MPTYTKSTLEEIEVRKPLLPGVPLIVDDWSLAFRLGFTGKTTWYLLGNRQKLYKQFMIKKKSGGLRRTFDPAPILRLFQTQLRARILLPLCSQLGDHVSAYQVGKSTIDAARMHLRPCEVCDASTQSGTRPLKHYDCPRMGVKFKMDLKDFFLSTSRSMIRKYFNTVVGYNHYASSLLGQLLTTDYGRGVSAPEAHTPGIRTGVPPGALCAGDICNLVADHLIDYHMKKAMPGWKYTRYADDLYFSCDRRLTNDDLSDAMKRATRVILASGYRVNQKKTQVQPWTQPQRLLGVNINRKLNIPAPEYRRMHMILYMAAKKGFASQLEYAHKEDVPTLHAWITGKLSYFTQIAPGKAAKLKRLYKKALAVAPEVVPAAPEVVT